MLSWPMGLHHHAASVVVRTVVAAESAMTHWFPESAQLLPGLQDLRGSNGLRPSSPGATCRCSRGVPWDLGARSCQGLRGVRRTLKEDR